jgi:hypothetical protein
MNGFTCVDNATDILRVQNVDVNLSLYQIYEELINFYYCW